MMNAADIADRYGNGSARSTRPDAKGCYRINCPIHKGSGLNCLVWDSAKSGDVMFKCTTMKCPTKEIADHFRDDLRGNHRMNTATNTSPPKKEIAPARTEAKPKSIPTRITKTTPLPADICNINRNPPEDIAPPKEAYKLGKPDHVYTLLNSDGTLFNYDYRWDNPPVFDRKQFRPCYYYDTEHTHEGRKYKAGWHFHGSLDNKPFYGADKIAAGDTRPWAICEGHKTMEAAQERWPDLLILTWQGSAGTWNKTDWRLLANSEGFLIPDADEPGTDAMDGLAAHLYEMNTRVRIMPTDGMEKGQDLADPEPAGMSYDERLKVAVLWEPAVAQVEEWPELISIDQVAPGEMFGEDAETFPLQSFDGSPWLRDFAAELAVQQNVPVEVTATIALGMLSSTIQRRVIIEGKTNWQENTNLWVMVIFPPGATKSATLEAISEPAVLWGKQNELESRQERILAGNEEKIIVARQAAVVRKVNKASTSADRKMLAMELTDLETELDALPARNARRLIYEDFTEESLFKPLGEKQNRESGIVISAESSKLFNVMGGMYSNGQSSCTLFPKCYDGERHVRDRVSGGNETLEAPLLSVVQFVQPKPFDGVINQDTFTGLGVIQRYILLRGSIDFANYKVDAPPIDEAIKQKYLKTITHLLNDTNDGVVLKLSDGAAAEFRTFRQDFMPKLCPDTGDFGEEDIAQWGAKHAGRILRLAACLHVAEFPIDYAGRTISADTMKSAITLGTYFLYRADQVLGIVKELPVQSNAKYALRHIRNLAGSTGESPIRHTDLWDRVKKRMKNESIFSEALSYLEERHILRKAEILSPGAKKPARVYHMNPQAVNHA